MKKSKTIARVLLAMMLVVMLVIPASATVVAADEAPVMTLYTAAEASANDTAFSVDVDGETADYDLSQDSADEDTGILGAHDYVDSYADNLTNDPGFKEHINIAIEKIRETISTVKERNRRALEKRG